MLSDGGLAVVGFYSYLLLSESLAVIEGEYQAFLRGEGVYPLVVFFKDFVTLRLELGELFRERMTAAANESGFKKANASVQLAQVVEVCADYVFRGHINLPQK